MPQNDLFTQGIRVVLLTNCSILSKWLLKKNWLQENCVQYHVNIQCTRLSELINNAWNRYLYGKTHSFPDVREFLKKSVYEKPLKYLVCCLSVVMISFCIEFYTCFIDLILWYRCFVWRFSTLIRLCSDPSNCLVVMVTWPEYSYCNMS